MDKIRGLNINYLGWVGYNSEEFYSSLSPFVLFWKSASSLILLCCLVPILFQVLPAARHPALEMLPLSTLLYCAFAGFSLSVVAPAQLLGRHSQKSRRSGHSTWETLHTWAFTSASGWPFMGTPPAGRVGALPWALRRAISFCTPHASLPQQKENPPPYLHTQPGGSLQVLWGMGELEPCMCDFFLHVLTCSLS